MAARKPLDEEFPLGDVDAVFCRWCNTGRVVTKTGKGVICIRCDTNTDAAAETADTASGNV